jgi:hypothetical protein
MAKHITSLLLCGCLLALCLFATRSDAQKTPRGGVVWEYKLLQRVREFRTQISQTVIGQTEDVLSNWSCYVDTKQVECEDPPGNANQLGQQGWELVSVIERSSSWGRWAGVSTEEVYYFKRIKP